LAANQFGIAADPDLPDWQAQAFASQAMRHPTAPLIMDPRDCSQSKHPPPAEDLEIWFATSHWRSDQIIQALRAGDAFISRSTEMRHAICCTETRCSNARLRVTATNT
jgi:hypothetical protein